MRQERNENKTQDRDNEADDIVYLPVQLHQHQDTRAVVLLDGLVELEDDRRADAQVRQREHGEDVRKLPLDALVVDAQGPHEDRAGDEAQDHHEDRGKQARQDIEKRILRAGHGAVIAFFRTRR